MTLIRDVMTEKAIWVPPETTLRKAASIMRDHDIGFLLVGEHDRLVGTVTDRDIVVQGVAENLHAQSDSVRSVMNSGVFYCFDDEAVEEVCKNISHIKVRRLAVVNRSKKLVGVVSLGDLAQAPEKVRVAESFQKITRNLAKSVRAA